MNEIMNTYELLSYIKSKIGAGDLANHKQEAFPHTNIDTLSFDTTPASTTVDVGGIRWNTAEQCLEVGEPGGSLQIGQEIRLFAKNRETVPMVDGDVVYVSGAAGSNIEVKLASASDYLQSVGVIAVATETVAANANGRFTMYGMVRPMNTNAWPEGTLLYLSATPGKLTNVVPSYPNNRVVIGHVTRQSTTVGEIGVKITYIPRKFGDPINGNFTGFEDDGTLLMVGNATVYNDIITPGTNLRPGASSPSFVVFQNGVYEFSFSPTTLQELHGTLEMHHDYKEGSDIEIHVHWSPSNTNVGDCIWKFEYTKANMSTGTFGATTTLTSSTGSAGSGTAFRHQYTTIGVISGTGMKIGDIVAFRLYRDAANVADTFTGEAFLLSFGCHYQCDALGSRSQTVK